MVKASHILLAFIFFVIMSAAVACTLSMIQTDTSAGSKNFVKDIPTETISPETVVER